MDASTQTRPSKEDLPSRLGHVKRSERSMVIVRGLATVFALVQVLSYRQMPYPDEVKGIALALVGVLALGNLTIWLASRRTRDLRSAFRLSYMAMVFDVLITSAFVWLYAFDTTTAMWAVLFIMALEGAIRFSLSGALSAWAAVTILYTAREIWGSGTYDYPLQWESISFRMGIGLLIALVAGLMARDLLRQRSQLSRALQDLSRIDRLRSGLVATLAHDVRNPLTAIRGNMLNLARYGSRMPDEQREDLVRETDQAAARLERLATDLLDLARLEDGRLDLNVETIPLRPVIEEGLEASHSDQTFEVHVPEPLSVRADRGRLEQIVVNLATNAAKYGTPPLVVEASRGPDSQVSISFTDHGPGLDDAQKKSLFEPFHTETGRSSVGLGLAIVRALVEAQGGEVFYESNRPSGAVFRLTLPVGDSSAAG
ncbi:MAG: sensor histidine kinase [Actinomycetota bacterium]